jgi:CubicO group peptidase (beta-lactamase class C family)
MAKRDGSRSRQFRVLYREFLFRVVDRELLSTHGTGDASPLLVQCAALLIFISILLLIPTGLFTGDLEPLALTTLAWSMQHFLIATTMLVVGIFAVLSWDNLFPDRRDVLVLAPLPVRARTLMLAKLAATATALALAVATFHAATGPVWPLVFNTARPGLSVPARTSDPARGAVVTPQDLQAVLDADFSRVLRDGPLAPGMGGGVVIGVHMRNERRVFAFGNATPDSIFEIGSISKPLTALALARLVEEGTVRLEQPVGDLLPTDALRTHGREGRVADATREITLLDLASHRSGLPGMPHNFRPRDRSAVAVTGALAHYDTSMLYAFLASHGLERMAGGSFRYSNLGYGLLGHALATKVATDYRRLVLDAVLLPLGMSNTDTTLSPSQQRRFMTGYNSRREPVPPYVMNVLAGAGGLRSTASDMLAWLEANLYPERLPAGSLRSAVLATHKHQAPAWNGPRMSLGWFVADGIRSYSHGGATAGHTGDVWFNPKNQLAVVVLSNSGPGSVVSADLIGEHIGARLRGEPAVSIAEVALPATGSASGLARMFVAYWATMFAAGLFMLALVMGMQGVWAFLLPRPQFLRTSAMLQMVGFATLVSVYCLQPLIATPATLTSAQQGGLMAWSPSYWFLGLFQQLSGSPALATLARRAWLGLGLAVGIAGLASAATYARVIKGIAEEPDIVPSASGWRWLPPFGARLPTALVQFSIRTLLRSAQHRIVAAFYLALGFAASIFFVKVPRPGFEALPGQESAELAVPVMLASVVMVGFALLGVRLAFGLPRDLRANWIFRIMPLESAAAYRHVSRRALLVLAVVPVWTVFAVVSVRLWPWPQAIGHLVALAVFGAILAEVSAFGARKIPFTCSYLPGQSILHVTFWVVILLLLPLALKGVQWEQHALQTITGTSALLAVLVAVWLCLRWSAHRLRDAQALPPQFEEDDADRVLTLGIWDSVGGDARRARSDVPRS